MKLASLNFSDSQIKPVMLIMSSASMNCSRMYLGAMSKRDCLAEGVIPVCTTMMAREMFSSCICWQYLCVCV